VDVFLDSCVLHEVMNGGRSDRDRSDKLKLEIVDQNTATDCILNKKKRCLICKKFELLCKDSITSNVVENMRISTAEEFPQQGVNDSHVNIKSINNEAINDHMNEPTATPITAPVFPIIEEEIKTPKSEKKKKKLKSNRLEFGYPGANVSGVSPKSTKVLEENNSWWDPLKHGETETVLPNKKYKGSEKIKEPAESDLNGLVAPAKSYTSTFLKKGLTKSVDSKKIKKDKKMKLLETDSKKIKKDKKMKHPNAFKKCEKFSSNSPQPIQEPSKGCLKEAHGHGVWK